jgi:RHS repeat-associated protein
VVDERYWVYRDALNPVAELDAQGNVTARFVYASKGHVPEYMIKGGTTYRLITDHLGSVRLVVDAGTGAVVQKMRYDAFGRVLEDTNPGFQPFSYAGGLYDPATSLVRFGARDYDPHTGRWTASDPIGFAGGDGNLYAYVGGDPMNLVDPRGNVAIIPAMLIGAAIGVSLDLAVQMGLEGKSWCEVNKASLVTSGTLGALGVGVGSLVSRAGFGLVGYLSANSLAGGTANAAATGVNNTLDGRNFWSGTGAAFLGGATFSAVGAGVGRGLSNAASSRAMQRASAKSAALRSWRNENPGVGSSGMTPSEVAEKVVKPLLEGVGFSLSNVIANLPFNP